MTAFGKAWKVLKNEVSDPTLNEYGDSGDPVNDAHAHFYGNGPGSSGHGDNDFDERYSALSREVSNHLMDVWDSYKDGHPEWDPNINSDTRTDREGPPGATELSELIEEMAKQFGAQLPW